MSKIIKRALLLTCILSLQLIKPVTSLYASPITLTYDGKEHIYNEPPITLEIDNENIEMTMPPVKIENRTLVPTREVFEHMGANVEWKSSEKKVYINHGDKLIVLEVDSPNGWVEGETTQLDVPPKIISGARGSDPKLMLPLRFISEALGFDVNWNGETSHIKINQTISVPDKPVIDEPAPNKPGPDEPVVELPTLITEVDKVTVKNEGDRVSVYTIHLTKPAESFHSFTEANKVVIDVNDAKSRLASHIWLSDNPYVNEVRTSQYTKDKTRVVFDLIEEVSSEINFSADKKTITVNMKGTKKPVIVPEQIENENMRYIRSPRETILLKSAPGLSANNIAVNNDYRNKKTTITLPGNFAHLYQNQVLEVASDGVKRIVVSNSGQTKIEIYENKIRAYQIIEDQEGIKIIFMHPREKYQKIVLLDLGHGGQDPGASGNGLVEKHVVFEQGMHLYRLLENDPNFKVYITRENDSYPTNPARAQLANDVGADLFISLHNNSFSGAQANGTEVLYSDKSTKGKQVAEIFQRNMVSRLGTTNRGAKARSNLLVLNRTRMPAVLVETAFLSNPGDAAKLRSPEFNREVGQVIYDSTVEVFNRMSFR